MKLLNVQSFAASFVGGVLYKVATFLGFILALVPVVCQFEWPSVYVV